MEGHTIQLEKKEKFISRVIIAVSIILGVLITVLLTGLINFFN
jgi:type IV secretory pathway component VirB8